MTHDPAYMREVANQLIRRIMLEEIPPGRRGTAWRAAHILYRMADLREAFVPMDVVLHLSERSVLDADSSYLKARNLALLQLGAPLDS